MMEVPGVGPGPAGTDRALAARDMAPVAGAPASAAGSALPGSDSVAALLRELSATDLTQLLAILDNTAGRQGDEQVETLRQAVLGGAAERDSDGAMEQFLRLAMKDPQRAEALASEPALANMRSAAERLLGQLAAAAKHNAEDRLTEASRLLTSAADRDLKAGEIRPEVLLLVATRLIEAGGLANYVRSAAAAGAVIDQCRWAPAFQSEASPERARKAAGPRIAWGLLFLVWAALGMLGGVVCWWLQYDSPQAAIEVWGAGLLALACLGAWQRMSIR